MLGNQKPTGVPLSAHIAKYFALAIVGIAAVWVFSFAGVSALISSGVVYEAAWGPAHAQDIAARIGGLDRPEEKDVPSAYHYLFLSADGSVRATDMQKDEVPEAKRRESATMGASAQEPRIEGDYGTTYVSFPLKDGGTAVLTCTYLPQYVDRGLRDNLPNVQSLWLMVACAGSLLMGALLMSASARSIRRQLAPLEDAAAHIAEQDLDFAIRPGRIREVNHVLAAMDSMRSSLADSLEARWTAERAQRDQVAALAHDLKTPLTVIRANAEYLDEEIRDRASLLGEDADAVRDLVAATERLDAYVRLLVETTRRDFASTREPVVLPALLNDIARDAGAVARSHGRELEVALPSIEKTTERGACALDACSIKRAVENLMSNACEHARKRVVLRAELAQDTLSLFVEDDGPGFSPAALAHGCERLYTDDTSRSVDERTVHVGLGLYMAEQTARSHNGNVELSNTAGGGARVRLSIPLAGAAGVR